MATREAHTAFNLAPLRAAIASCEKELYGAERFGGSQQQDAHEFMKYLLGSLELTLGSEVIDKHFGSTLSQTIKCLSCEYTATQKIKQHDLSVDFGTGDKTCTVTSLLERYFANEQLDDYTCEKCQAKGATRLLEPVSLAPSLVIHVMRFSHMGQKRDDELEPQETLTIGTDSYRLSGVVLHLGKSLHFGHYVALLIQK
eukprot:CAMPEP_0184545646 /NCGR_PEP_ID=MMETSP0199_2-20130426/4447_1 /TAXON_ID=1112570 /ORGANISM="Thraustochytrium sp., Strain LLF1b" /LENGTH=198 /DNA_ID=CAMNT_0026939967 /DNA_START=45 /DNA_END=638 /DNA_ORIENTATION=-